MAGKRLAPRGQRRKPEPKLACEFYVSDNGKEPVREWLWSLPADVCRSIGADIERVQWQWPISKPLVGAMGDGIFEVRTQIDGDIYRVFFCIAEGTMLLLHGFQKKTQKTPSHELDIAKKRQKEIRDT